jgi:predicted nucleic acid-binding protein
VRRLVIDASIAIKWVVEEEGTPEALALRSTANLVAPDLIVAECANILWKKVGRGELRRREAVLAGRLLERAEVELVPTRPFLAAVTRLAVDLGHPAYDCFYLALADAQGCRFVTADDRLLRKLSEGKRRALRDTTVPLKETAQRW